MVMLPRAAAAFGLAAALLMPAQAGIFDDDEARKAILDLRQKLEQSNEAHRAKQAELNAQMADQLAELKRSLLDLNNQIDLLRGDIAKMRGNEEQLVRDVTELQKRQKDITQGIDDRIRKIEPQKVALDGAEFSVEPEEKRLYEDAMATLKAGEYDKAATALVAFQRRYPASACRRRPGRWLRPRNRRRAAGPRPRRTGAFLPGRP